MFNCMFLCLFRACCGDGFSVFASDNGIIMTCGDGLQGCLGHGDRASTAKPRLIEALLRYIELVSSNDFYKPVVIMYGIV